MSSGSAARDSSSDRIPSFSVPRRPTVMGADLVAGDLAQPGEQARLAAIGLNAPNGNYQDGLSDFLGGSVVQPPGAEAVDAGKEPVEERPERPVPARDHVLDQFFVGIVHRSLVCLRTDRWTSVASGINRL